MKRRGILWFLGCASMMVASLSALNVADQSEEGFVLLEDGSIWMGTEPGETMFMKGNFVEIKGDAENGFVWEFGEKEIPMHQVGMLEEETEIVKAFDYSVENEMNDETVHGHFCYLKDNQILVTHSISPYALSEHQRVSVGTVEGVLKCLVDRESSTFVCLGVLIGKTEKQGERRTVTEVREDAYVFNDGFCLKRTLNPEVEFIDVEGQHVTFQFDPSEPLKLQSTVENDAFVAEVLIDLREELITEVEIEYFDHEILSEKARVIFRGSKDLKEAFMPTDLHLGETVSFYDMTIPMPGNVPVQGGSFIVRE